jgi:DNA-binding CsgD family transcriptional regulator
MSDNDEFDQRLLKPAQAYARLYPSILTRLKAACESGNPIAKQAAQALTKAISRSAEQREARLRHDHGLSPQEIRIALHLIDGGSVASCAVALEVAESTVRSHLKSIFGKTGVNRQAELPHLLEGGRAGGLAKP